MPAIEQLKSAPKAPEAAGAEDWGFEETGEAARGLRLALFSGNYNYTRDGANQALNRLVAYLESQGAEVRVYSPTTDKPAFAPAGTLVSVASTALPGRPEYRLALPISRAVRKDIERFAPTAIHVSAPDLLGLQALRMGARLGVPVVSSLHTRFETYLPYYGLGWLRPAAERYLAHFYGACDRVLAPNRLLGRLLSDQAPEARIGLWSRGVDRQQFGPAMRSDGWRASVGLGPEYVALLFLGRLVLEKGLDVFAGTVDALADLPRLKVVVVGDGPAAEWLRGRMPGAVFTGHLTGEALGRAVASADIFFNPSLTEAFGNVTLEAMAAGLPVVCADAPSTRELIHSGEGVLIPDPTPEAYAAAIRALALDPARRARIGAAARLRSKDYNWRSSCSSVLDTYRELGALDPRSEPEPEAAPAGFRSAPALLVGVGLLLLAVLLRATDIQAAVVALGRVGWAALAVIAAHLLVSLAAAIGWRALLPPGDGPGLWTSLRLRLVKEGVNACLPVAQVGGDVVRARMAAGRRLPLKLAAAAAVVDAGVGLVSLALFIQIGLLIAAVGAPDPEMHAVARPLAVAGGLLVAAFCLAEVLGAARLLDRVAARARGAFRQLDGVGEAVRGLIRGNPRRLAASFFWHMASWGFGVVETWAALSALGLGATAPQMLMLESLVQGARALGFAIPGAIGVQEGGYILVCSAIGIPTADALALSVLRRMRELSLGFVGLALWRFGPAPSREARG